MEDSGSQSLGFRLDIKQILLDAQHRWLRPAEISEILRNYRKFLITPEPPQKPVSGSVFLFDKKALRYFRNDGHNWRKKKDGKTVKEAHEKLKVGSVDMLHCYYARGEDNENFHRRSYWMLEQELMHIVFVHYLEVKGNKSNVSFTRNAEVMVSGSKKESSSSFSFPENGNKFGSTSTDSTSPTSTLTSAYEEESEQSSGLRSEESWVTRNIDACLRRPNHLPIYSGDHTMPAIDSSSIQYSCIDVSSSGSSFTHDTQKTLATSWEEILGECSAGEIADKQESVDPLVIEQNWQHSVGDSSLQLPRACADKNFISNLAFDNGKNFFEEKSLAENLQSVVDSFCSSSHVQETQTVRNVQNELSHTEIGYMAKHSSENSVKSIGTGNYPDILKKSLLGGAQMDEGLKKVDSFSRWMAKELGEVEDLAMQSNCGISWSVIDSGSMVDDACIRNQLQLDTVTLSPSISQDQLFSIIDFSPNWAYSNHGTEVLITGTFLKTKQETTNCKWSCMFGEVEVPAEVFADGILQCHAPRHGPGLVPFYVTCSNRLACSEVREFEYRLGPVLDTYQTKTRCGTNTELHLLDQFERLISLQPVGSTLSFENIRECKEVVNKLIFMMEEENCSIAKPKPEADIMCPKAMNEQHHEKDLKNFFYSWLLHKVTEDGKGPAVLDEEGQSVLHLAAALGYNWVFQPAIVSGVSIDFRDANGWTALHWAAFYGREQTVAALVSLGASPGALTDPSAEFPLGQTPADLASANGHKGISGFLAESSLTTHLSFLTVNDTNEDAALTTSAENGIQTVSERVAIPTTKDEAPDVLSLKDSLAAVCNATQAAARIHQIFRIQSFQRKQIVEQDGDDLSSDEHAFSLLAAKSSRVGRSNAPAHAAAVCIQKKYRGWKKRKEFLLIRQRIVKIQAHVRGHQARKKYRPIVWSVGILEKVILRWRRKGSGLRGFRHDTVLNDATTPKMPPREDDYDFLKEGRKQTEERLQKALARVKSMAQNPEARAQYRRLLTVAEDFREIKDVSNMIIQGSEDNTSYPEEELFDFQSLLDDDTFMSLAFE